MRAGPERLYHASPLQGLTQIVPRVGTHGQNWVYATDDIAVAAVFLGRLGGDFTCASGICGGRPYLCERFAGAFKRRYGMASGSLYVLPGGGFLTGQTSYSKDFVTTEAVTPLEEIRVDNAENYLLELADDGRISIKFSPERYCIPDDDRDLVEKAVRMYELSGQQALDQVQEFHPGLLGRVWEKITKNKT
jgi:hypothetical protein